MSNLLKILAVVFCIILTVGCASQQSWEAGYWSYHINPDGSETRHYVHEPLPAICGNKPTAGHTMDRTEEMHMWSMNSWDRLPRR